MKYLKNIVTQVAFILILFVSFNSFAQINQKVEVKEMTPKDQEFVKEELRKGMASFVESLKSNYRENMNYNEFIKNLVGENSTAMPDEGKNILKKSFEYLSRGLGSEQIERNGSIKEIAAASLFVFRYNEENKSTNGDLVLFGKSNVQELNLSENKTLPDLEDCKWYQIGCHVRNIRRISLHVLLNFLSQL